jgi:hypothetical protein
MSALWFLAMPVWAFAIFTVLTLLLRALQSGDGWWRFPLWMTSLISVSGVGVFGVLFFFWLALGMPA